MPLVKVDGPALDSTAALLTAAFNKSPLWVYLLPVNANSSVDERSENMTRLFRMYLDLAEISQGLQMHGSTKANGELECAFFLEDCKNGPSFWNKVSNIPV